MNGEAVIDQAVAQFEKHRNESKEFLRDASKNAGGNYDIIVFRNRHNFRRIIKALETLKIFWCEVDGEILTNRHELYDAVSKK